MCGFKAEAGHSQDSPSPAEPLNFLNDANNFFFFFKADPKLSTLRAMLSMNCDDKLIKWRSILFLFCR